MSGKQPGRETAEPETAESTDSADSNLRKRFLQGVGGASVVGLAGCLGDEGDDDDNGDDEETATGDDEPTDEDEDEDVEADPENWLRDLDEHGWEADADAATDWDNYEVTELEAIDNLMSIDVDPEGRVWYITRGGYFPEYGDSTAEVGWIDDEGNGEVVLELDVSVGSIPEDWGVEDWADVEIDEDVENDDDNDDDNDDNGENNNDNGDEENDDEENDDEAEPPEGAEREIGGQGIAIDPDFGDNGYVYIWYHPSSEDQEVVDNPYHEEISMANARVSRFEFDGEELDADSEEIVLNIPYNRTTCCHHGGYLEFGPEGHLWVTTGDDSNNVGNPNRPEIDFFTGDERDVIEAGRPANVGDAQRTAANTADLRGSVLRITPTDDGDEGELYEVPEGNLKTVCEETMGEEFDDEEFRPEIYVMGCRNPYVVHVDEHTGYLFVADYGNDATESDPEVGPIGMATYSLWCEPGNNGWPYCKGLYTTRYYDFEAEEIGQPFWQDNLRNRSPNNTGIENIPDFTPNLAWQPQNWDEYVDAIPWLDVPRPGEITWPELPSGGSANAGVAYRYSDDFDDGALDPYFEGKQFAMAPFAGSWIGYFTYNDDGSMDIDEFLPDHEMEAPTDMVVLPDGRVVIMAYGEFSGEGGGLYLIEYEG